MGLFLHYPVFAGTLTNGAVIDQQFRQQVIVH